MTEASGSYPARPVTFISAAPPGGGWHQVCVKAAAALRAERLVPVEVEVVTNPGGLKVFEEVVAGRRGDGHTLVAFSPGLTAQILMKGSRYSYADITPVASLSADYGALAVPAESPMADLATFVKALRRRPDAVAVVGGQGPGAMHEAMVRVVAATAGVPAKAARYVGAAGMAAGIAALLAGDAPVGAFGVADVAAEVRKGSLRLLAVLAERRLPEPFESVPTGIEQGLEAVFPMWRGFFGPPEMPDSAVRFWSDTFTRLSTTPTWAALLAESTWFPFLLTGSAFSTFLNDDTRRYARVLAA